jgi:hypothetical protein
MSPPASERAEPSGSRLWIAFLRDKSRARFGAALASSSGTGRVPLFLVKSPPCLRLSNSSFLTRSRLSSG